MINGSDPTERHRIERDSMGEMRVPDWALWGASTQRAVENFPIAMRPLPGALIHALGTLKAACAQANRDLAVLPPEPAAAIIKAAEQVALGRHDRHFPVDVFQTGSGTSTNMNANEVIANLANIALGGRPGARAPVHPNNHVNMGQSSNDVFPTAMHIACALATSDLIASLTRVFKVLHEHAARWEGIVKIGRTHLMDATPIRLGQVFGGYAAQIRDALSRAEAGLDELRRNLPIGGTAVGTGLNTHPEFGARVCAILSARGPITFEKTRDHCASQAAKDSFVDLSGHLKCIAVSLSKIANDIRHLGSGPRCGLGELKLPAIQPGSSIMPGKVNPVISESVIQVAARVIANDLAVTTAGLGGVGSLFELNVAMPLIADASLESLALLTNVTQVFVDKLLLDLEPDEEQCRRNIERSLMVVTALAPRIGYDQAASLAKRAHQQNRTIRELALEQGLIAPDELDELLDPLNMA